MHTNISIFFVLLFSTRSQAASLFNNGELLVVDERRRRLRQAELQCSRTVCACGVRQDQVRQRASRTRQGHTCSHHNTCCSNSGSRSAPGDEVLLVWVTRMGARSHTVCVVIARIGGRSCAYGGQSGQRALSSCLREGILLRIARVAFWNGISARSDCMWGSERDRQPFWALWCEAAIGGGGGLLGARVAGVLTIHIERWIRQATKG